MYILQFCSLNFIKFEHFCWIMDDMKFNKMKQSNGIILTFEKIIAKFRIMTNKVSPVIPVQLSRCVYAEHPQRVHSNSNPSIEMQYQRAAWEEQTPNICNVLSENIVFNILCGKVSSAICFATGHLFEFVGYLFNV